MDIKNESLDMFHEKQELDIFLSSFKAIHLLDDIPQGNGIVTAGAEKSSPVFDQYKSLYLIHEKEETDIFLSRITTIKPPDEIIQEKAAVTTETDEKLPVSDDLSAFKSAESQIRSDEEDRPAKGRREKIVIATRSKEDMQISFALPEDKKVAEDRLFNVTDASAEQLQTDDQDTKDKSLFAKEPPRLVQVQEVAIQMSDAVVVPPSAKVGIEEQTVVLKSEQKIESALERPSAKKIIKLEKIVPELPIKKSKQVSWGASMRFFALFLVFIVVMQGYLWMYPEVGYQTIEWVHSNFPMMDQLLGIEKAQKQDIITDQVEFINVRQRFVKNESLGNLRVIEGEVVNQAAFPIAKVRVIGELFGTNEALLAARISYCGKILPDETLERLKEEEIRSALSVSSGGNLSDNKILPRGQIPFMIVFTHEPSGVTKATVTAVGAEKISP